LDFIQVEYKMSTRRVQAEYLGIETETQRRREGEGEHRDAETQRLRETERGGGI